MGDQALMDPMSGAAAGSSLGPWGAGAGAALGIGKYFLFDKPANERQRALAAATQKFSPWTGLSADAPSQINPMSSAMGGAGMGAALGQNMAAQQQNNQLQQSQIAFNKAMATRAMGSPGTQTYSNPASYGSDAMGSYVNPNLDNPMSFWTMQRLSGQY